MTTRREMIATTGLATGAFIAGCDGTMREARGINIIDVWTADPAVRDRIGASLEGHRDRWIIQGHIAHHASECQKCHECEKRCPFHVKVAARNQLAAKLFGV